nr:hypothetical protein [Erythrocladia irregularis]
MSFFYLVFLKLHVYKFTTFFSKIKKISFPVEASCFYYWYRKINSVFDRSPYASQSYFSDSGCLQLSCDLTIRLNKKYNCCNDRLEYFYYTFIDSFLSSNIIRNSQYLQSIFESLTFAEKISYLHGDENLIFWKRYVF